MNEFDIIEKYFLPLTQNRKESGQLKDDAALLKIPAGYELAVTSDTLNANTHFLEQETPDFIAHKALRVNLSDLAAMGAKPYAYQLCMAFPEAPAEKWLQSFTDALLRDQDHFKIFCSGGDTTSIKGPLSISITAFGLVPENKAVKRNGAKPGDHIIVTGPVGNAFIGLQILQNKLQSDHAALFIDSYKKPTPRTVLAEILQNYAHAAIDISDGLVADLSHICKASGVGAQISAKNQLFSKPALTLMAQGIITVEQMLTGGDDYELLLAIPPASYAPALNAMHELGMKPADIGRFTDDPNTIRIDRQNGVPLVFERTGWRHF